MRKSSQYEKKVTNLDDIAVKEIDDFIFGNQPQKNHNIALARLSEEDDEEPTFDNTMHDS